MISEGIPPAPDGRSGWPWDAPSPEQSWRLNQATNPPRITVVTPSYNQGDFLEAAIRSVLLQGYPNLQYIVVDGGSTDQSSQVLDKYRDHISTVICEPDEGQSDAICKGLAIADGEFFSWINSDDILMPGALTELGTECQSNIDLFTFAVSVFGDGVEPYTMLNENLNARAILRADHYSFSQPGLWFRTSGVHDCGGIDRDLNYGFDWDLMVRYLATHPRVSYSANIGAGFRLHADSKTSVESAKQDETSNQFCQESLRIRDKLEETLAPSLASASRLGRQREPWNQHLVDVLDDVEQSPLLAAARITASVIRQPRVRLSTRTLGAIARLLSRYVRPKASYSSPDSR